MSIVYNELTYHYIYQRGKVTLVWKTVTMQNNHWIYISIQYTYKIEKISICSPKKKKEKTIKFWKHECRSRDIIHDRLLSNLFTTAIEHTAQITLPFFAIFFFLTRFFSLSFSYFIFFLSLLNETAWFLHLISRMQETWFKSNQIFFLCIFVLQRRLQMKRKLRKTAKKKTQWESTRTKCEYVYISTSSNPHPHSTLV